MNRFKKKLNYLDQATETRYPKYSAEKEIFQT